MTMQGRWIAATLMLAAAAFARAAPGDADNAATWYRQAFQVIPDASDPDAVILNNPDAVRLDDGITSYLRQHDQTFELLRKGAACPRCDWGVDPKQGSKAQLPHLAPARGLANLARLRARYLFQQRRHADAVDEVVALLALSRHIGSDPFVVAKLMEAGVADSAVEAASHGVATMPPEVARAMMEKLDLVPKSMPPAEVVKREGQQVAAEVRRSGGEAAAREVAALFEEAARHLALPFEQSFAPVQTWETRRQAASAAAQKHVPSLKGYRLAVAAAETRVFMLSVAGAVRADGKREVFRFDEPHAGGPLAHRDLPGGGFELESKLVVNGQPLKLTCKPVADEVPF